MRSRTLLGVIEYFLEIGEVLGADFEHAARVFDFHVRERLVLVLHREVYSVRVVKP